MRPTAPTRLRLEPEISLTRDVFLGRVEPPIVVYFLPHSSHLHLPIPIIFQQTRQLAHFCTQMIEFASFFAAGRRGDSQRGDALQQALPIPFASVHCQIFRASVRACLVYLCTLYSSLAFFYAPTPSLLSCTLYVISMYDSAV